jgi:hypothetical protein
MDASNKKREKPKRKSPPAKTAEGRENQLISLAIDLAEKQLANGTASAQVQTHFLKLGTVRARLELEKIEQENLLLAAKTDAIESGKKIEELYSEALAAMRSYQGRSTDNPNDDT